MQSICSTCEKGSRIVDNHCAVSKRGFTEETETSKLSQGSMKLLRERPELLQGNAKVKHNKKKEKEIAVALLGLSINVRNGRYFRG